MNTITSLQTELLHGGRLENGRITQRVLVTSGQGGDWYELSMSNDRANQRDITARREDCATPQPVTAANAASWLTRLRDHKDTANPRANILTFTPAPRWVETEVGA